MSNLSPFKDSSAPRYLELYQYRVHWELTSHNLPLLRPNLRLHQTGRFLPLDRSIRHLPTPLFCRCARFYLILYVENLCVRHRMSRCKKPLCPDKRGILKTRPLPYQNDSSLLTVLWLTASYRQWSSRTAIDTRSPTQRPRSGSSQHLLRKMFLTLGLKVDSHLLTSANQYTIYRSPPGPTDINPVPSRGPSWLHA